MSQKANPTTIGLFFILGLMLGMGGLLAFSSRSLFHPMEKEIVYFDASLKGLNPGAPVKYRGVTIGAVQEILIRHNQSSDDFSMPVIIAIDKKLAQDKSDQQLQIGSSEKLSEVIGQGFRARLDTESLVTGVLYVELEVIPDAPPPKFHQLKPEYHEIPTVPSQAQYLLANLAKFDAKSLSENLNALLVRLNTSLAQLDFAGINAGVTNVLEAANNLISNPDLAKSLKSLNQTLDEARTVLTRVDSKVDPVADSITNTLDSAQKTLIDLRVGIRNVSDLAGPDSALRPELIQTLEQLENASRAVADLAEFLKRNPNALLTGTKQPKQ
jgi:phospholipid/cholesterol/gamma-HCH transport system substrate-binding protein